MRVISTDALVLPAGWDAIAQAALADVVTYENHSRRDRNAVVNGYADTTWRALKDRLEAISKGKCWYCETIQARSPMAVDHFRPKGSVRGLSSHPGYWWLAFVVSNYRLACTLCNSPTTDPTTGTKGGKHQHFPLWDSNKRAMARGDDHTLEEPMLLDPLVTTDPPLLTWEITGNAAPRYLELQNKKWHDRAKKSIDIYHLNQHKIHRLRKKIHTDLQLLVNEGDLLFASAVTNQPYLPPSVERVTSTIISLIHKDAQYSAAANQYLTEIRCTGPRRVWLDGILAAS